MEAEVAGGLLALQGEEAQGAQPVVDPHQDQLPDRDISRRGSYWSRYIKTVL